MKDSGTSGIMSKELTIEYIPYLKSDLIILENASILDFTEG
jgi:hypothetical protein